MRLKNILNIATKCTWIIQAEVKYVSIDIKRNDVI